MVLAHVPADHLDRRVLGGTACDEAALAPDELGHLRPPSGSAQLYAPALVITLREPCRKARCGSSSAAAWSSSVKDSGSSRSCPAATAAGCSHSSSAPGCAR